MVARRGILLMAGVLVLAWLGTGCATVGTPAGGTAVRRMQVTAYCPCQKCCSWTYKSGRPVYAYGPLKGRPKQVGITSSGTRAKHGTIAADLARYPYGTLMYINGYGYGRVEDCGGAIDGNHIDLFFDSHRDALKWGNKTIPVQIWFKGGGR